LQLVGVGGALRDQALPVLFRTNAQDSKQAPLLAVGQALNVVARTGETIPGIRVPIAAIVKNPGNQDTVWLHTRAEQFVPKVATFVPLDGTSVAVTSGLEAGQRVVTQGATLLNQVR
jgi:membrane fusion protein, heavy metal efflux system